MQLGMNCAFWGWVNNAENCEIFKMRIDKNERGVDIPAGKKWQAEKNPFLPNIIIDKTRPYTTNNVISKGTKLFSEFFSTDFHEGCHPTSCGECE